MLTILLFFIGFLVLIKGAGLLVNGAASVAKRLNVTDLVIGLTVVAFGTSMPEMFVNIFASIRGNADIAVGNILGSNICNIFLILGIAALVSPLRVRKTTVWKEIPFSLLAAVVVGILANDRLIDHQSLSILSRIDGLVLIVFFIIFMIYIFEIARDFTEEAEIPMAQPGGLVKSLMLIVLGLASLMVGGHWIVGGAVAIAQSLGVSESLIGLTIVAVGTSLPEMATSIVAAFKKNSDIAVGNIVGSNIFNIFWILGLSAVIHPLPFKPQINFDVWMTILASLILFLVMFLGKKHHLQRLEGILFLGSYIGYLVFIIRRG